MQIEGFFNFVIEWNCELNTDSNQAGCLRNKPRIFSEVAVTAT